MKKALILKDDVTVAVLRETDKLFISLGEFFSELSHSQDFWDIKYINLMSEELIPLRHLSSLLDKEIVKFHHLEKYAIDIKNFLG